MGNERSFAWFVFASLALAILYTWLYNITRGSLLLVTLFHASGNTIGMILPVSLATPGGLDQNVEIVLFIVAAVIVFPLLTAVFGFTVGERVKPLQWLGLLLGLAGIGLVLSDRLTLAGVGEAFGATAFKKL